MLVFRGLVCGYVCSLLLVYARPDTDLNTNKISAVGPDEISHQYGWMEPAASPFELRLSSFKVSVILRAGSSSDELSIRIIATGTMVSCSLHFQPAFPRCLRLVYANHGIFMLSSEPMGWLVVICIMI